MATKTPEQIAAEEAEAAQKQAEATAQAEKEAAEKEAEESKASTPPQPAPSAERMMILTLEERNQRMAEDRMAAGRLNEDGAAVKNDNGTITATFGKK